MSLFRSDSLVRHLLQRAWDSSIVAMDKTYGHACRIKCSHTVCDVHPDKCWFAVLCRFWLRCSRTLNLCADYRLTLMQPTQTTLTAGSLRLAHQVALRNWRAFSWLADTTSVIASTPWHMGRPGRNLGGFERHLLTRVSWHFPFFTTDGKSAVNQSDLY